MGHPPEQQGANQNVRDGTVPNVTRETEVAARTDAALIKGLMRRTVEDIIEIGKALIRQQTALGTAFDTWIDTEFEMSRRSAFNFMGVARKFGDRSATVALLPLKALYELASSTLEVQAEVERRIAAGELVSGETNSFVAEGFSSVPLNAKSRPCGLRHAAMTTPACDPV